jgi:hypothetical protein
MSQGLPERYYPTSEVYVSTALLLLSTENWIIYHCNDFQWHNVHTKFRRNRSVGSRVETSIYTITVYTVLHLKFISFSFNTRSDLLRLKKYQLKYVVSCMGDYRRSVALDIGFIDHFNTQLVITLNYSAIADLRTLQFTRAHAKSSPTRSVFSSNCLVTASNNGYSCSNTL